LLAQPFSINRRRPSVAPVVFFKLMFVSRRENLGSNRRFIAPRSRRLDACYFSGYKLDEAGPWHSRISRTRQLFPAAVFKYLFAQWLAA
jgi:hypothetical protein